MHVIYLGVILEYSNRMWGGETGKGRELGQGALMSRFLRAQLRLSTLNLSCLGAQKEGAKHRLMQKVEEG